MPPVDNALWVQRRVLVESVVVPPVVYQPVRVVQAPYRRGKMQFRVVPVAAHGFPEGGHGLLVFGR